MTGPPPPPPSALATASRPALAALLLLPALAPSGALGQEVSDCDPVPPVTALIEPWEETAVALAGGAVRLAVLEGEQGTRRLLVLVLPPPEDAPDASAPDALASDPAAPPPERLCRIVSEGGLGFADLDLAGAEAAEDPEAATLAVRVPALGFVPESTELRPEALVLTFGVADGSLEAAIEAEDGAENGGGEAAP